VTSTAVILMAAQRPEDLLFLFLELTLGMRSRASRASIPKKMFIRARGAMQF